MQQSHLHGALVVYPVKSSSLTTPVLLKYRRLIEDSLLYYELNIDAELSIAWTIDNKHHNDKRRLATTARFCVSKKKMVSPKKMASPKMKMVSPKKMASTKEKKTPKKKDVAKETKTSTTSPMKRPAANDQQDAADVGVEKAKDGLECRQEEKQVSVDDSVDDAKESVKGSADNARYHVMMYRNKGDGAIRESKGAKRQVLSLSGKGLDISVTKQIMDRVCQEMNKGKSLEDCKFLAHSMKADKLNSGGEE